MNAAVVARTLSLIPDRVARMQTGSVFDPNAPCAHPERIVHLLQFLHWLGPLQPLTRDDLRILGLLTPYAKPAIASGDDEADDEPIVDDADEMPAVAVEPSAPQVEATVP